MNASQQPGRPRATLHLLKNRIDQLIDQRERFAHMAEPLQAWADKWSTTTLARWLAVENLPLEEHEKALVALALKATDDAGAVIDTYNPWGLGEDHELFYRVIRLEWEQRREKTLSRAA